jgi:RNA polymerase sigma factor (sigma-70 family)
MSSHLRDQDQLLLGQCLSHSTKAWDEFYVRFLPLVRRATEKHASLFSNEWEDIVQEVFISLHADLHKHDSRYTLSQFVWIVAKRVCVDHYRTAKAAKRDAQTVPVDHHDGSDDALAVVSSHLDPQDKQLETAEHAGLLKVAFTRLGKKCRDLLRLRYFDELAFMEIASILGANKKSLAVQAGRCIDELRGHFADTERTGLRS